MAGKDQRDWIRPEYLPDCVSGGGGFELQVGVRAEFRVRNRSDGAQDSRSVLGSIPEINLRINRMGFSFEVRLDRLLDRTQMSAGASITTASFLELSYRRQVCMFLEGDTDYPLSGSANADWPQRTFLHSSRQLRT